MVIITDFIIKSKTVHSIFKIECTVYLSSLNNCSISLFTDKPNRNHIYIIYINFIFFLIKVPILE